MKISILRIRQIVLALVLFLICSAVGLFIFGSNLSSVNAQSVTSNISAKVSSIIKLSLSTCNSSSNSLVEVNIEPTPSGTFQSNCQTVNVSTNAPGYTLSVKASSFNPNYQSGATTNAMLYRNSTTINPTPSIPSTTNNIASPNILANDTWGFAVEGLNNTTTPSNEITAFNFDSSYTENSASNKYASLPTTDTAIYKTTTFPLPETTHKFFYAAKLTPSTMAGSYATTVVYTAVGEVVVEPPQYIKSGMVLHYDGIFNAGSSHSNSITTWTDLSSNGNDGTFLGSPVWGDSYLSLDGSDDGIALPSTTWLNNLYGNTNTVEMRFTATEALSARGVLWGNYQVGGIGSGQSVERNSSWFTDGSTRFYYKGSPDLKINNSVLSTNTTYTLSIAYDLSEKMYYTYINGTLVESYYHVNFGVSPAVAQYYLGRDSRTGATSLLGEIESFRVYDRVLAASEVMQNYEYDVERFE